MSETARNVSEQPASAVSVFVPEGGAGSEMAVKASSVSGTAAPSPGGDTAPFFSLVMPAYNAQTHIDSVIQTLVDQPFDSWEIIVVDDCSTDGTREVVRRWADADARIRLVVHEANQGPAAARNTGMAQARGTWLWMPDSDDTFDDDILVRAHDLVASDEFDVVLFGFVERYVGKQGEFLYDHPKPLPEIDWSDPKTWRPHIIDIEQSTHYGYPWNKMYRLQFLRDINAGFERVILIEDILFNIQVFDRAQRVGALGGMPYCYFKQESVSVTNSNAYSAADYYAVHHRRIQTLRDQLSNWGVLDARAKGILGSLYARYILSTLERNCYAVPEGFGHKERVAWAKEAFSDPLFNELVPAAQATDSKALSACLCLLKGKRAGLSVALGRLIYLVHHASYGAYTKIRSGR